MRLELYRQFHKHFFRPLVLPRFVSRQWLLEGEERGIKHFTIPARKPGVPRIWFHAASVGELESLWTVIEGWAGKPVEIVITVFSESAWGVLKKLETALKNQSGTLLYLGYSPWEGGWNEALQKIQPSLFVTAKYEAWPELWVSLERLEIPLVMVAARVRRSLQISRWLSRLLGGGKYFKLHFCVSNEDEMAALLKLFPQAKCQVTGDPRWDRVQSRAAQGNRRVQELILRQVKLPRPWGVLGSVWMEDLEFWGKLLTECKGSLWIVPHRLNSNDLNRMEKFLQNLGLLTLRTSSQQHFELSTGHNCILVDEMGFLSELYSVAAWAYVGGGFSKGVHNIIEPAIHGIPVVSGTKRAERFSEIHELRQTGQLTLVHEAQTLKDWLNKLHLGQFNQRKASWVMQAKQRLGATTRVLNMIDDQIDRLASP